MDAGQLKMFDQPEILSNRRFRREDGLLPADSSVLQFKVAPRVKCQAGYGARVGGGIINRHGQLAGQITQNSLIGRDVAGNRHASYAHGFSQRRTKTFEARGKHSNGHTAKEIGNFIPPNGAGHPYPILNAGTSELCSQLFASASVSRNLDLKLKAHVHVLKPYPFWPRFAPEPSAAALDRLTGSRKDSAPSATFVPSHIAQSQ